ncbi:hypothetical protein CHCC20331_2187 [Bacillus paralicheniformis]|nr:hypothetical protein CHCC20331_2187 [Bacillus paralicheniformis]
MLIPDITKTEQEFGLILKVSKALRAFNEQSRFMKEEASQTNENEGEMDVAKWNCFSSQCINLTG